MVFDCTSASPISISAYELRVPVVYCNTPNDKYLELIAVEQTWIQMSAVLLPPILTVFVAHFRFASFTHRIREPVKLRVLLHVQKRSTSDQSPLMSDRGFTKLWWK